MPTTAQDRATPQQRRADELVCSHAGLHARWVGQTHTTRVIDRARNQLNIFSIHLFSHRARSKASKFEPQVLVVYALHADASAGNWTRLRNSGADGNSYTTTSVLCPEETVRKGGGGGE